VPVGWGLLAVWPSPDSEDAGRSANGIIFRRQPSSEAYRPRLKRKATGTWRTKVRRNGLGTEQKYPDTGLDKLGGCDLDPSGGSLASARAGRARVNSDVEHPDPLVHDLHLDVGSEKSLLRVLVPRQEKQNGKVVYGWCPH